MSRDVWILVAALLALGASCTPRVITARNSVHPVLLGPVETIGGKEQAPAPKSPWESTVVTSNLGASNSNSSYGERRHSAAGILDFSIYHAASDDPHWFRVDELDCRGFAFFGVAALWSKLRCTASGQLLEATRWAGRSH